VITRAPSLRLLCFFAANPIGLEMKLPPTDADTGLPLLRRWHSVYFAVLGIFVLWVVLLTWLTRHFA
jgi:hypothetical protein